MASEESSDSLQDVQESLLEFPCKFPIKAMGRAGVGFEELATKIILRHSEIYAGEATTNNPSGSGNFISVTVTIMATSKVQLDNIYQDLTDCEHVLVAL
jgi:putative lipoic acid-binding regulatory protein